MFYCDCNLNKKNKYVQGKEHITKVDENECCIDCGNYAIARTHSRYNLEDITNENKSQNDYESMYELHTCDLDKSML